MDYLCQFRALYDRFGVMITVLLLINCLMHVLHTFRFIVQVNNVLFAYIFWKQRDAIYLKASADLFS